MYQEGDFIRESFSRVFLHEKERGGDSILLIILLLFLWIERRRDGAAAAWARLGFLPESPPSDRVLFSTRVQVLLGFGLHLL